MGLVASEWCVVFMKSQGLFARSVPQSQVGDATVGYRSAEGTSREHVCKCVHSEGHNNCICQDVKPRRRRVSGRG